ncbi:MAG: hypothetical protein H6625_08065 [Bdellovibrionaceae bacterium]|nr:hypothetical protein [Pseudobdellovibrionaceae bacterium]
MKFITILSILFSTTLIQAATRSLFMPDQALILIQGVDSKTGEIDYDPYVLYDLITAPVLVGPSGDEGKIIKSSDEKWSLTCVHRPSTGIKQCQVILRGGSHSKIDLIGETAEFKIDGVEATELFNQFAPQKSNEFEFITTGGALKIISHPNKFHFKFH